MGYAAATLTTARSCAAGGEDHPQPRRPRHSLLMYVVFTIGIGFWFGFHGIVLGSWPMVAANAITFVLAATILALKLRYG